MKRIVTAFALFALVPAVLLAERTVDESRDAARDGGGRDPQHRRIH